MGVAHNPSQAMTRGFRPAPFIEDRKHKFVPEAVRKARRANALMREFKRDRAATTLQKHQRGMLRKQSLADKKSAIQMLQAHQRGHARRASFAEKKQAVLQLQAVQRGAMRRVSLEEKKGAALTIQASFKKRSTVHSKENTSNNPAAVEANLSHALETAKLLEM